MISDLIFYKLLLVSLVWLCVMIHVLWTGKRVTACPAPPKPTSPRRTSG